MNKKPGLHPRNKHKNGYNFSELRIVHPPLNQFIIKNKVNENSIDFSNNEAVLALNTALLKKFYNLKFWAIPQGFLCPPIPGRADYIHHIADLLADEKGEIPRGNKIHMLDIGTGSNCIYPLIAHSEYGWKITGSEIDPVALKNAQTIVEENNLKEEIKIIHQPNPSKIFENIINPDDYFLLSICNPPFHSSAREAAESTMRKNKNLGLNKYNENFGGQNAELWCRGGEKEFILKMIHESVLYKKNCKWFSSLVSKSETLPFLYEEFKKLGIRNIRTIDMSQGQKKSRIIAWSHYV